MKTQTLKITKVEADRLNAILEVDQLWEEDHEPLTDLDVKYDDTLQSYTVDFGDGYQADIEVCTGQSNAFINAVLFLNGHEVDICEDGSTDILGEYDWSDEDEEFHVDVVCEE